MSIIIALDLGTTGNRTIAYSTDGTMVAQSYKEFHQSYPKPAWVEHDALEIWDTCMTTLLDVLKKVNHHTIISMGITNQRETIVMWDTKTGNPLHPAIVWQCRRTEHICSQFKDSEHLIKEKTGLPLDPYFSATKIKWLLDTIQPDIQSTKVGTIDSWILWKLTNGRHHLTDVTNASRTLLMNLSTKEWDPDLIDLFTIPREILPTIKPSSGHFGTTSYEGIDQEIPIHALIGDQQAAFFAQAGSQPGTLKNTYGTGCFLMGGLGHTIQLEDGLITTVALSTKESTLYALEGSIFMGGATIQWLRDNLNMIQSVDETNTIDHACPTTEGVYFVPALTGLGAPYWNPHAKGILTGLTRKSTKDHIIRAAIESLAYQTADIITLFSQTLATPSNDLWVDGGASNNPFLMQFQADIIQKTVKKPMDSEMTALGAAGVAGLTSEVWDIPTFLSVKKIDHEYTPKMKPSEVTKLINGWTHAISQCQL